jgi:POT family proton-dependent oligopeptide transporter
MVMGLITYLLLKPRYLAGIGERPAARSRSQETKPHQPLTREDWRGIAAVVILAFFNIFFWVAFEQAGSSLTFFAEERTRREFLGLTFLAPYFQSINPVAILVLAPVFAWLWGRLAARGREPSTPAKFAFGLLLVSLGFAVMVMAARLSAAGVSVSPLWLVATYVLQTCGELCLSPVGLSMVTKLAPVRFASLMMGVWFLSSVASNRLAGVLAGQVEKIERGEVFHLLGGQADFYLMFVVATLVAGVALFALARPIKRLMAGRA